MKKTNFFKGIALLGLTVMLSIGFIGCKQKVDLKPTSFTVTFNANGGEFVDGRITKDKQAEKDKMLDSKPATEPIRINFIFKGWYEKKDGLGLPYDFTKPVTKDLTLYAHWEIAKWTVTFDANTGKFAYGTTKTVQVEKGKLVAKYSEDPTRTGFVFVGWYEKKDGSGSTYDFTKPVTKSFTLYAKWEPLATNECLVTFDANGGEFTDGKNTKTQKVKKGKKITELSEKPKKDNFIFIAWFTKATDGEKYDFNTAVNENIRLYAQWKKVEKDSRLVTFDSTGGSEVDESLKYVKKGKTLPAPNDPKRIGYTFKWWSVTKYGAEYDFTMPVNKNFTLYAIWKAHTYTIKFDGNGSNSGPMTAQTFTYNKKEKLKANSFKKTECIFTGWKDKTSNKIYTDNQEIENLTSEDGKEFTFTAQWEINKYTVNFDSKGGSLVSPITRCYNKTIETEPVTTKVGYTFLGWYTKEGTKQNFPMLVTKNMNLNAYWKANTYTIKFDGNGADNPNAMSNQSFTYDKKTKLSKNTFTKGNLIFTSWARTETGPSEYSDEYEIKNLTSENNKTITLFAQWRERKKLTISIIGDINIENNATIEVLEGSSWLNIKEKAAQKIKFKKYSLLKEWHLENEDGIIITNNYHFTENTTIFAVSKTDTSIFHITSSVNSGNTTFYIDEITCPVSDLPPRIVIPDKIGSTTIEKISLSKINGSLLLNTPIPIVKEIEFPSSIKEIYGSFNNCTELTNIKFPKPTNCKITSSFQNCTSLTKLDFSNAQYINFDLINPNYANPTNFAGCTNLESIKLPKTYEFVGISFWTLPNLKHIEVVENNEYLSSEDGILFNKDKTAIIAYPIGKTETNYNLPISVKYISNFAFMNCKNLENIDISNITGIGNAAFCNCTALTLIDLSSCENLTYIKGWSIFWNCKNAIIKLPNTDLQITANKNIFGKLGPTPSETTWVKEVHIPQDNYYNLREKVQKSCTPNFPNNKIKTY